MIPSRRGDEEEQMDVTGTKLVAPHGGQLRPLIVRGEEGLATRQRAERAPVVRLNSREVSDVIMLATGSLSPLRGFLCRDDYVGVVEQMRLREGVLWPMPITLSVSSETADAMPLGREVALVAEATGELMGSMTIEDKYGYHKRHEAREVFGTEDEGHPGVRSLYSQGEVYLGGSVKALSEGRYPSMFPEYARPEETRKMFTERRWNTVTAFQTRNPIHRSHEYLIRVALEVSDAVLVHPTVGALEPADIPADVRMRCYRVLLERYLSQERVVLKVHPMEMRYGGPREAVLHAIVRQNFGCSQIIIGRDHAGVGSYYGALDAQEIFDQLDPGALQIRPLKLDCTFWCNRCEGMASLKTCPHSATDRLLISGSELRRLLAVGLRPPVQFSRPEVLEILMEYYNSRRV